MKDEQIIALYQQRDESAVTETAEKHGDLCRKVASSILSDPQDIDECVNDSLLRAWNTIPPEVPRNLAAYMITITRNIALDKYKYNKRIKRGGNQIQVLLDELTDCIHTSEDVEDEVDEKMLTLALEKFLDNLSYNAQTVFVQRYVSMLSISDIAKQYNLSESNVKVTLSRVRKSLRKYLKQEEWL